MLCTGYFLRKQMTFCFWHRTAELASANLRQLKELLGRDFDLKFEKGVSYYREPNGEAAWTTFSTGYGPTKSLATSLDDARRAELRRDFIAFHDGFPTDLGICDDREPPLMFLAGP